MTLEIVRLEAESNFESVTPAPLELQLSGPERRGDSAPALNQHAGRTACGLRRIIPSPHLGTSAVPPNRPHVRGVAVRPITARAGASKRRSGSTRRAHRDSQAMKPNGNGCAGPPSVTHSDIEILLLST